MTIRRSLTIALAACALAAPHLPAQQTPTGASLGPPTIAATGHATEDRAPDQAEVSLGVQATGKTSAEAQDALNKTMDKVIKAVKDVGLANTMIQTQGIDLQPEYEQEDNRARSRAPRIIGYRAGNTIRARTSEVDRVGRLIDAGVAAGSNQVWGITFSLKDDADARREAIRKATTDAKMRAQAIADALGLSLGKLVQASTAGAQVRPVRQTMMARAYAGVEMAAAPTPVEAGEVSVTADVTVEFAVVEGK